MAKREISVYAVAIASSFLLFVDITGLRQVSYYLPRSSLSNAYCIAQLPGGDTGMLSQIAKHQSMIGEKGPLRHCLNPQGNSPQNAEKNY